MASLGDAATQARAGIRRKNEIAMAVLVAFFVVLAAFLFLLPPGNTADVWFLVPLAALLVAASAVGTVGGRREVEGTAAFVDDLAPRIREQSILGFGPRIVFDNGVVLELNRRASFLSLSVWLDAADQVVVPSLEDLRRWLHDPAYLRTVGMVNRRRGDPAALAALEPARVHLGAKWALLEFLERKTAKEALAAMPPRTVRAVFFRFSFLGPWWDRQAGSIAGDLDGLRDVLANAPSRYFGPMFGGDGARVASSGRWAG